MAWNKSGAHIHVTYTHTYLAVVNFLCGLVADVHDVAVKRRTGIGHQGTRDHWVQHGLQDGGNNEDPAVSVYFIGLLYKR
jgi:hypothetical protein